MKLFRFILALLLLLSTTLSFSSDTKEQKQDAGIKAAANFLNLIDSGKYSEAFKQVWSEQKADKDTLQSEVSRYRKQVGKLRDRKLLGAEYTTKSSAGKEGEYVVVTIWSSFERLGSAIEVVVPQLLPDGTWVISGYSIKPADVTE